MSDTITLTLTGMAHGGAALGREMGGQSRGSRVIFVPYALPGEEVEVELVMVKERYAQARLQKVLRPSADRVSPPCPYFGVCSGCHFQHIAYPRQLALKEEVVRDQLGRIAGITSLPLLPIIPNPEPYGYASDLTLSPTTAGGMGLWAASERHVIPVDDCLLPRPPLRQLLQDVDMALPDLRRVTLRMGDDGALLAALEVEDVEPPEIGVDFPVSVALVLPDGTAANLIGDNYVVQAVGGRDFRVSAGAFFYSSPPMTEKLVQTVLAFADLRGGEQVLELYSGVGTLTAFLAAAADEVTAIEANVDAVADMAVNLEDVDNVSVYEGAAEAVLPLLTVRPDVVVVDPGGGGMPASVLQPLIQLNPNRLIYVSDDVATLARDARHLTRGGYRLAQIQPLDMEPQTFHILTVSLWQPHEGFARN